ncbi:MAG TPA: ATPase domain-containing protein [Verrucomicrobiae bacterium]|jgi:circadian clock protein KaiC
MDSTAPNKCETGIAGLNDILNGGFPRNRLYLIQGDPGVGKTTLALQYLLEGAAKGERGLYVTLSETTEELTEVARSHGWPLEQLAVMELSATEGQLLEEAQNTLFHPSEVELNRTTKLVLDEVERTKPARLVFDSLSEMRLLAETPLRYRRQMLALKQFFAGRQITVLMLDDRTSGEGDLQVQSIAHGVIALEKMPLDYGVERRRMKVVKMRGLKFRGGYHDFIIEQGGLQVFPRLVAAEHHSPFQRETVSSTLPALDALLGGGLDRGTSNLFMGPAGAGKSTLAMQYAVAMASRGERVILYSFDEGLATLVARAREVGMDVQRHMDSKMIQAHQVDPAELPPGQFAAKIREAVHVSHAKLLIIDSVNGYMNAMPDEKFLSIQMHELLSFLGQQGTLTILTMAQNGLMGPMTSPVDLSYLADTVLLLRYFEAMGSVKKAISVIKKRSGHHETTIREYKIGRQGIEIGEPLKGFHGVLTGVPTFFGKDEQILGADGGRKPKLS